MDPNANLMEQNELVTAGKLDSADRQRLAELRRSLASWINFGGFQPDWNRYPVAARRFKTWGRYRVAMAR